MARMSHTIKDAETIQKILLAATDDIQEHLRQLRRVDGRRVRREGLELQEGEMALMKAHDALRRAHASFATRTGLMEDA